MFSYENRDVKNPKPNLVVKKQSGLLGYDTQWEFPIHKLKLGKLYIYMYPRS